MIFTLYISSGNSIFIGNKKATIRSPFSFLSLYSQENSPSRSLGAIAFGRWLAALGGGFGARLG